MDNLKFYRQAIEAVLQKYAGIIYAYGEIEQYLINDKERNHLMLFDVGWQQK